MLFQTCITFLKLDILKSVFFFFKSYNKSPVLYRTPLPSIMDQNSVNIIDINPKVFKVSYYLNEGPVRGLLENKIVWGSVCIYICVIVCFQQPSFN